MERSTTPFCCGLLGSFQCMPIPKPTNHNANGVGRSSDEPHGVPLSTRNCPGIPQRPNHSRKNACVWLAGTCVQLPWGKNAIAQRGATALVDHPQATGLVTVAQTHLIHRSHLPTL